jgi:hypothetical protein
MQVGCIFESEIDASLISSWGPPISETDASRIFSWGPPISGMMLDGEVSTHKFHLTLNLCSRTRRISQVRKILHTDKETD